MNEHAKIKPKIRPIHHYVREWRKHRGFTLERLAEETPYTAGAIAHLETGRTGYTQDMLEALAKALDCKPGDLLLTNPLRDGVVWSLQRQIELAPPGRRNLIIGVVERMLKTP